MKEQAREDPKIVAAAERQMQAWSMTQQMQDRSVCRHPAHRRAMRLGPYIAISREAGAGGGEIAQALGQQLGWEVLDKNLLDHVAKRFHLCKDMLEVVDETAGNWVHDVLGSWIDREVVPHEKYVACLSRVVLAAARQGNVVLVGRGAWFLLPHEGGLGVRIIAPEDYRIAQIMQRQGLGAAEAHSFMETVDRGRRDFVRRYFHRDINDPHLYDLVLNVERLGPAGAVAEILAVLGRKQPAAGSRQSNAPNAV